MASVFPSKRSNKKYVINYTDEHGRRRKKTAFTDRRESERLADKLELEAQKVRDGLLSRREISIANRQCQSVAEHITDYHKFLLDADKTAKHADLAKHRLIKLFKLAKASTLRDISLEGTQSALSQLRQDGRGLKTLNHYGDTAKGFLDWCKRSKRIAENPLVDLLRYKADTDVRHERRSISVHEFNRLLDAARSGETYGRMTGPLRELCYRFAFMTGLRFGEIKAMRPEWLNFQTLNVTVPAKIAKNRKAKTLPIDSGLAEDLKTHIATLKPGSPVFPMPKRGYAMIQVDLEAAGIPYEVDGKHFDFHALRGMTATILDEIGTPEGVRRNLMRHSSQTMTNLYTRPRDDQGRRAIDRLASKLREEQSATGSATEAESQGLLGDANGQSLSGCGEISEVTEAVAIPAASTYITLARKILNHWSDGVPLR